MFVQVADQLVLVDGLYGGFFVEDDLVAVEAVAEGVLQQDLLGCIVERFTGQVDVEGLVAAVQVDVVVEDVGGPDGLVVLDEAFGVGGEVVVADGADGRDRSR